MLGDASVIFVTILLLEGRNGLTISKGTFVSDQQVVIHCQSGDRATIGYSILAKHGFKNVKNYSGGMNEWSQSGNEVVKEN